MILSLNASKKIVLGSWILVYAIGSFGAQRSLLVFLDDSDTDIAVTNNLLTAIAQDAGPILTSATLLANISNLTPIADHAPAALVKLYQDLRPQINQPDQLLALRNVIATAVDWRKLAPHWTIKLVNPQLYLLIPDSYLTQQRLTKADINVNADSSALTATELRLGLKVNHLSTVTDLAAIRKPETSIPFADYFITALGADKGSVLFVLKTEYQQLASRDIPTWSLYLNGHGSMKQDIAHLSLAQFKQFLHFLAAQLNTKLLYYQSCYAAGVNSDEIYRDEQGTLAKTYPFAIITGALTDATISIDLLQLKLEGSDLKLQAQISYPDFLAQSNGDDQVDYRKLAVSLTPDFRKSDSGLSTTPQIKFPGLAWFSVLENEKVAAIGAILAKTRSTPLDIGKFFARNSQEAEPLGILLYANDVPFELIVNTGAIKQRPPDVISMIPGDALHHLQQLTSTKYSVDLLLNSFLRVEDLIPQKMFIIKQLSGFNSSLTKKAITWGTPGAVKRQLALQNVIVYLTEKQNSTYFMYNGTVYRLIGQFTETNKPQKADAAEQAKYTELLATYGGPDITSSAIDSTTETAVMAQRAAQQAAQNMFAPFLSTMEQILQNLVATFSKMLNQAILRLPSLKGPVCQDQSDDCWMEFFANLSTQTVSADDDKIVWFDQVLRCVDATHCTVRYLDFIIRAYRGQMAIYFKDANDNSRASFINGDFDGYAADYLPDYKKAWADFMHQQVDTRSGSEALTPDAMAKIRQAQAAKVAKAAELKTAATTKTTMPAGTAVPPSVLAGSAANSATVPSTAALTKDLTTLEKDLQHDIKQELAAVSAT